jgi:GGDEF domain-containing protein
LRNANGTSGFTLAASAGVAYFDKNGPHSIEELTAVADAELYKNKEKRRHTRGSRQTISPSA